MNPQIELRLGPTFLRHGMHRHHHHHHHHRSWPSRNARLPRCVILSTWVVLGLTVRALLRRFAWKIWPVALRLSKSLKVIGTDTDRSDTYDFWLTFCSNHGISRSVSAINGDFSWKSQIFHTLVYLTPPPVEGVPLGINIGTRSQKN